MRRLLQICKKVGLSRQRNIDDGTFYSVLSSELGKYQFMYALIYVSTHSRALRLVAKRRDIKSFYNLTWNWKNVFLRYHNILNIVDNIW